MKLLLLLFASLALAQNVTFTFDFDDTFRDGLEMVQYLEECGWHGSFFISSQRLCLHPDYLERGDVNMLYNRGHEIASHGLSHMKLIPLQEEQLMLQMCCDKALLEAYMWNPTSLAYAFAQYNHTLRKMAQRCKFCNARAGRQGLWHPEDCPSCPAGDTVPPADKWKIMSYSVKTTDRLAQLQERVNRAVAEATQHDQRWVLLNFHKLCEQEGDKCNTKYEYSTLRSEFAAFVAFLKDLSDQGKVVVKTMKQVIHESTQGAAQPVPRSFQVSFDGDILTLQDGIPQSSAAATLGTSLASIVLLALVGTVLF